MKTNYSLRRKFLKEKQLPIKTKSIDIMKDLGYVGWLENKLLKFDEAKDDFEKAVEPAIRYLLKNCNPHTKIYIDYNTAELLQGQQCYNLDDEIPD